MLGRWAGWPEQEIAATLRCTTDEVRTEIARGAAAVRSALHPASVYRRPVETFVHVDTDREVREALDGLGRSLASSATPLPAPDDLRREVVRVRRRWWLIALAACCGAALVAVVVLAGGGGGTPADQAGATTDAHPGAARRRRQPTWRPAARSPTTPRSWPGSGSCPGPTPWAASPMDMTTPESRRVLFAGDVPGARWALLVGEPAPAEAARSRGSSPTSCSWRGSSARPGPRPSR